MLKLQLLTILIMNLELNFSVIGAKYTYQ